MCRIRKDRRERLVRRNQIMNIRSQKMLRIGICLVLVTLWLSPTFAATETAFRFTDAAGREITLESSPSAVISLVPSITEIICRIGAADTLKAVTYHDTYPPEVASKAIVGGFFLPSLDQIEHIQPDIIFVSELHTAVREKFAERCQLINLNPRSVSDIYRNISVLGKIFNREGQAEALIVEMKRELQVISEKVARIPASKRKRVIRLMGRSKIMTPGDDSFQNEFIRLTGGIPPTLGRNGQVVDITKEEWKKFNPQVIYGCGDDREMAAKFFDQPGWKDVEAVQKNKIFYFSCDLTCRASSRSAAFVSYLSASIYTDEYVNVENQVLKDQIVNSRPVDLPIDYVKDARIVYNYIHDFLNKTLVIDFTEPLSVVSTLEGERNGIISIGNHYSPPPCSILEYADMLSGLEAVRGRKFEVLGKSKDTASFLFTGADMDNLAITSKRFKDMEVFALVTAGVMGNALRMSCDEGSYYELGTINIILLSNMQLTSRAMTRAIITATEAKTAALQDLDIRSSYSQRVNQATGTGTDNIIVVSGKGQRIDATGGHTKMGELIARAVYQAVQEAIYKQNSLIKARNVFQRMQERDISISGLFAETGSNSPDNGYALREKLEEILLQPRYSSFLTSSFALSDAYEKGLIRDLGAYGAWCENMAEEIAGREIENMKNLINEEELPPVIYKALNALLNGIYYKENAAN